jgi:hypothetical protein
MRLDTKPSFHPRTLTFESAEEWDLFISFLYNADFPESLDYDIHREFRYNLHNLINNGLVKI